MTQDCIPAAILAHSSAVRIHEYLVQEVASPADGLAAMAWLEKRRPGIANEVLCLLYGVACYKTSEVFGGGDSSWFISVLVGSDLDDGKQLPTANTIEQAHAIAVKRLGLRAKFYGAEAAIV